MPLPPASSSPKSTPPTATSPTNSSRPSQISAPTQTTAVSLTAPASPLEIIRAVRAAFPDHLPVWVRVSAVDWVEGGLTIEDSVEFARLVKAEGIDLLDVSSGGNDPRQQIPIGPGYQVAFADRIRRETGLATGAVGMITDPAQADQIIRTHQADVVLLARELLREPYWPLRAATELHQPASYPVQYERAAQGKVQRRQPLKT